MRKMGGISNYCKIKNSFKIGRVNIDNPVIVAPMAGVTDYPYRRILTDFSPGLICGEMVSAKGLLYDNYRSKMMIKHHQQNIPYSQQIFGSDPDIMVAAAKVVEKLDADLLDINMGCPAPKIVKNGDGAALLRRPDLVKNIVSKVVDAVTIPVTVKIRTGFDSNTNTLEISEIVQEAGAQAVIIHGRTCEQQYSGQADWSEIAKVKEQLEIPVIGNGDIFHPSDALQFVKQSNCEGVMLGRGIQGNPWLVRGCANVLGGGLDAYPEYDEIKEVLVRHFQYAVSHYGSKKGIVEMRKHISWYLKGLPNSSDTKNTVMRLNDENKILKTIENYFSSLKE